MNPCEHCQENEAELEMLIGEDEDEHRVMVCSDCAGELGEGNPDEEE